MFEVKLWRVVLLLMVISCMQNWVHGKPQVPCYFIFGDSLADNGNNDKSPTAAKADYPPYGIDFAGGKSGRFTNGRTIVDILAELMGFEHSMPSFANLMGSDNILEGVNYASGGSGIRDETGSHLGVVSGMNAQLKNHKILFTRMLSMLGNYNSTISHLNKCMYTVGLGNNDYLNNYLLPKYYRTSHTYGLDVYPKILMGQYYTQLKALYNYGARKVALFGLGQIGCVPRVIDLYGTNGSRGCVDYWNNAAVAFNKELLSLVDRLNHELVDAKFIFINNYEMGNSDLSTLGFKFLLSTCCQVREDGQCKGDQKPCDNRSEYVFFDSFHQTEASNKLSAKRIYDAFAPSDAYPFDMHHLATLSLDT